MSKPPLPTVRLEDGRVLLLLGPVQPGEMSLSLDAAAELAHAILSLPEVQETSRCTGADGRSMPVTRQMRVDEMIEDSQRPTDESQLELTWQLRRGEFRALLDPRLRSMLLRDVAWWWQDACNQCFVALFQVLGDALRGEERVAALESWRGGVAPDEPPSAEWDWALGEARVGAGGIVLAMDAALHEGILSMNVLQAECLLARQLSRRLPSTRSPVVVEALAALLFLEQWSP